MGRYFLTVDWCSKGRRGVFCDSRGNPFGKDVEHTEDEIDEILGSFSLILSPQSSLLAEEELAQYSRWVPLAEYSNFYGVALKSV